MWKGFSWTTDVKEWLPGTECQGKGPHVARCTAMCACVCLCAPLMYCLIIEPLLLPSEEDRGLLAPHPRPSVHQSCSSELVILVTELMKYNLQVPKRCLRMRLFLPFPWLRVELGFTEFDCLRWGIHTSVAVRGVFQIFFFRNFEHFLIIKIVICFLCNQIRVKWSGCREICSQDSTNLYFVHNASP